MNESKSVKVVTPNCEFEFGRGNFDNYCIYRKKENGVRGKPKDYEYFAKLKAFGKKYGYANIYKDLLSIYQKTTKHFNPQIGDILYKVCVDKYGENDGADISVEYITVYMGMVAELNKEHSIVGSRVKMLGLYQTLMCGMLPKNAADFSRGMSASDINKICDKYKIPQPNFS